MEVISIYKGVRIYFDGDFYVYFKGNYYGFPTEQEVMEFIDEHTGV